MTSFRKADVQANPNVQNNDILSITLPMINRVKVEGKSEQTITSYERAAEHILPKGFRKIRHIGFLSSRSKKEDLAAARQSLGADPPEPVKDMTTRELIIHTTGKDPYACPVCGEGEMIITTIIPPIRAFPAKIRLREIPKDRKVNLV